MRKEAFSGPIENKEKPPRVLRIGIDLDNTTFDINELSLSAVNKEYQTNFIDEDIENYYYIYAFLEKLKRPEEEIQTFRLEVYGPEDKHRVYRDSTPLPGAVETLRKFHSQGHRPFILTSRPPGLGAIARIEEQFRKQDISWIEGDWVDGGNILIRDEYYWKTMTAEEFKLHAIRGDFTDGKYQGFEGLDLHLDDMGELLNHPLAVEVQDRIFILARGKYNAFISNENLVPSWEVFYNLVYSRAWNKDFDLVRAWDNVAQC